MKTKTCMKTKLSFLIVLLITVTGFSQPIVPQPKHGITMGIERNSYLWYLQDGLINQYKIKVGYEYNRQLSFLLESGLMNFGGAYRVYKGKSPRNMTTVLLGGNFNYRILKKKYWCSPKLIIKGGMMPYSDLRKMNIFDTNGGGPFYKWDGYLDWQGAVSFSVDNLNIDLGFGGYYLGYTVGYNRFDWDFSMSFGFNIYYTIPIRKRQLDNSLPKIEKL